MKRKTLIALIISSCLVVVGCVGLVFWALAATQVNVKTSLTVTYKPELHVVCDVSARYQKTTDSEPISFNSGTLNLEYGDAETAKNMSASETDIVLNDTNTYVIFEFKFANKNLMPNYVLNISLTDNANFSNVKRKYFFGDMMFFNGLDLYEDGVQLDMVRNYMYGAGVEHEELETTTLSIGYQGVGKIYMLLEITPGIVADYTASQLNQFMFTLTTTEENNAEPVSYLSSDWANRTSSAMNDNPVYYLAGGTKTIDFTDNESKIEGLTYIASVGTTRETTHSPYPSEAVKEIADVSLYFDEESQRMVFYSPAKIYAPVNSSNLFFVYGGIGNDFQNVTAFNLDNFDTSKGQYAGFFQGFESLTSVDVSHFDTTNMVSMGGMFSGCSSLTNLDVSNFDTSKVTSMSDMFSSCSSLTSLDVSNFDTSKVTSMSDMFSWCDSLTSLDVSNFNTSNVTDMSNMFSGCSSLTSLDVSNFNTSNVTNMKYMFSSCSSLTNLDVSNFDTSKVTSMEDMFYNCSSLTSLNLGNFNLASCTNFVSMLNNCPALASITLPYNLQSGYIIILPARTYYNGSAGPYDRIGTATSGITVACSTASSKVTLTKH